MLAGIKGVLWDFGCFGGIGVDYGELSGQVRRQGAKVKVRVSAGVWMVHPSVITESSLAWSHLLQSPCLPVL